MYTYTGPSWAASSYPIEDKDATNLAKLWNIPHVDQSVPGAHAIHNLNKLYNTKGPVVWLYNEPLRSLTQACKIQEHEFLERDDWRDIWLECNEFCLNSIARIGRPVLLFGSHSDIVDCEHKNIQVGHKSWQRFLAEQAGMDPQKIKVPTLCWGADILHLIMHENPDVNPNKGLVDEVYNIFSFWKHLEKSNLFYDVHPNLHANKLFAEYTKPIVEKFLEDTK